jgi:hypothetical protein
MLTDAERARLDEIAALPDWVLLELHIRCNGVLTRDPRAADDTVQFAAARAGGGMVARLPVVVAALRAALAREREA